MKTANLAIVFTDIKGFTQRTSAQTLEQNERLLAAHSELLVPLFKAFGGHIIKSIGDAFLVTFESPTQAVLSGVAIQDRLWQHNRQAVEADRIEVRVAVNVGEVRVEKGDVFGEPVNIAARVEGVTDAGEVYFTEAVYLSMNKAEVPSAEVGAFELKGIPGKVKVFKVPKAPYRVEAPVDGAAVDGAMPPYGNLGLSRVRDDFAAKAVVLGGQLVDATSAALAGAASAARGRTLAAYRRPLLGAAGALLVLGAAAFVLSGGSKVDAALREVESASASERPAKVEAAQKLIDALKDPGESKYYSGRLEEAEGDLGGAAYRYREAAQAGNADAVSRLIALLDHPKCRVRAYAAQALGELKTAKARGKLEALVEHGGPGENDIPIFGCNSRNAAREALEQLR